MVRFGLALVCGVSLAAGCGKAEDEGGGTGGAWTGGSSATGGAHAVGGSSPTTGGVGGSASAGTGGASGVAGAGGSVSVAGAGGSISAGGSVGAAGAGVSVGAAGAGGSVGVAGAAVDAGAGRGTTGGGGVGGSAGAADVVAGAGGADVAAGCPIALPLKCGDRLNHSTITDGRPNTWGLYSATQRAESGRETIYSISTAHECMVVARLKNLTTDLDLLLVPTCNSISSEIASSTPIDLQTVETISWTNPAGKAFYVVVDGYAGAEGSYTLEVDCTCD